ncbi:MAG TPA: threonine/serine dehydratase [Candidatus Angelobacter sp.]|nr:threonine/serine dehydratase [Candidatus Angelobacter sp.]
MNTWATQGIDCAKWGGRVLDAHQRIRASVLETPLEDASDLFPALAARVLFKREDLQRTGSFKLRGAANKLLSLTTGQRDAGITAASTGNHGMGVASAAAKLGASADIYVSTHVPTAKVKKIESYGARVCRAGDGHLDAELAARAAAAQSGKVFISPYNDADVMTGQGTIAVEMLRQSPKIDAVFVAVGGGGLIGGIGAYLKWASPQTEVVGCWPQNSPVLYESIKAGRIIEVAEGPTVSESTAGGLESGSITLDVCRDVIDHSVLVSENEILAAMRIVQESRGWLMEGAAGTALAAFLQIADRYAGKTVVVVICGGNVSEQVREQVSRR